MNSSTGTEGAGAGLPPWLLKSVVVVGVTLGGLVVMGQLGRSIAARAGAEASRRVNQDSAVASRAGEVGPAREGRRVGGLAPVAQEPIVPGPSAAVLQPPARGKSNFLLLPLPKGVTVELPKNWVTMTDIQRVTLESAVEAMQGLAGITHPESELPFAANYMDDAGNVAAMFNARFYPGMTLTQDGVLGLSASEINEIDAEFRKQMSAQEPYGVRILEWLGTTRSHINGIAALVADYRRAGARAGTAFRVRLVRVFNTSRSFTVTVSYREDAERLLRPICDRIIASIAFTQEPGATVWALKNVKPGGLPSLDPESRPPEVGIRACEATRGSSLTPETAAGLLAPFVCQTRASGRESVETGTGTLIGDGLVLTCAHVLSGPDLTTTFPVAPWKGSYEAEVLFVNTRRDVAILRAKGLRNDRWANVRLHGATNAGEAILAVGNPSMGIGGTNAGGVASGIISNPLLELDGGQYLSADVSIASGSSGGPLFSLKDGALVGLVQFVATAPGLAKDEAGVSSTGFLALAAPAHFLGEWLGLKLTPAK